MTSDSSTPVGDDLAGTLWSFSHRVRWVREDEPSPPLLLRDPEPSAEEDRSKFRDPEPTWIKKKGREMHEPPSENPKGQARQGKSGKDNELPPSRSFKSGRANEPPPKPNPHASVPVDDAIAPGISYKMG